MEPIVHNHDQQDFDSFVGYISPLSNLIVVSCMYRGQQMDYEDSVSSVDPQEQEPVPVAGLCLIVQLCHSSAADACLCDDYRTDAGLYRGCQRHYPGYFRG